MKVVIAPDSFKGSLSAVEAARAMRQGVLDALPGADVGLCPMADGGEGTVEAIAEATGAELVTREVAGPMPGGSVRATWALLEPSAGGAPALREHLDTTRRTGVIELAQASGFSLVKDSERDPLIATTLGTGELIVDALDAGCASIIVGIGGSATVDGGTGIARALGYRFLDAAGKELPQGGGALERLDRIDTSGRDTRIDRTRFLVASDVDNEMTGERGAARIFGPQKGATPAQVETLERGLDRLAQRMKEDLGVDVERMPGGGAAGGAGAGLMAFCGAKITGGAELVAAAVGLDAWLRGADLALTGEGSFDSQTLSGKTPAGVMRAAGERGVPVVIIAGRISADAEPSMPGRTATFCLSSGPMTLQEAMGGGASLVRAGTARMMRLLLLLSDTQKRV
jgi:glycerate kinase